MTNKLPAIKEEDFQEQVIDLLKIYHWRYTHFRPAWTNKGWRTPLRGDKGYFDITAVRGSRIIFAELKSEKGEVSPEQQEWIDAMRAADAEVYLWRPTEIDEVARILR